MHKPASKAIFSANGYSASYNGCLASYRETGCSGELYSSRKLWDRLRLMMRFRYIADPLCLASLGLYCINRFIVRPHWHRSWIFGPFIHDHLNDSLLVPVALPLFLAVYRVLSVRSHDGPPTLTEVLGHSLLWSLYFEVFAPFFLKYSTADFWDAVSYFVGGILAWFFWNRHLILSKRGPALNSPGQPIDNSRTA